MKNQNVNTMNDKFQKKAKKAEKFVLTIFGPQKPGSKVLNQSTINIIKEFIEGCLNKTF